MEMSNFARTIMEHKYSHTLEDGSKENWNNIAYRTTKHVMKAAGYNMRSKYCQAIHKLIRERKFIPGGRYLAAAGNSFHQTQNCLMLRAEDSREGWSELLHKASMALMTGAGIGIEYSLIREEGAKIRRTGGTATGPLALMQMINECGRGIIQGGSRRAAIWAGLNWQHPDAHKFIVAKDWIQEVRELKERDFNFPATLDMTNISIGLDDEFFEAYNDPEDPQHSLAHGIYWTVIRRMCKTGEPGFSVNCGHNVGEDLRNAPISSDTFVLTKDGYKQVKEIIGIPTKLWTGYQWSEATFVKTKENVKTITIEITGKRFITCDLDHEFFVRKYTGAGKRRKLNIIKVKAKDLEINDYLDVSLPELEFDGILDKEAYTAGFLFGDDSEKSVSFCTEEKKRLKKYIVGLCTKYNDKRGYDRYSLVSETIKDHIPDVNCAFSFLAGWFDADGSFDSNKVMIRLSGKFEFLIEARRLLECLGILSTISAPIKSGFDGKQDTRNLIVLSSSIARFAKIIPCKRLNLGKFRGYKSYRQSELKVINITNGAIQDVYCCNVGVEEHSFIAEGVRLSNCTEVTSANDSDICNLGSINLSRIHSLEEMEEVVELAIMFLLAGTLYSDVPYPKVDKVRNANRRLGLGLMGVHEWLLTHGKKYGPDEELEKYLKVYLKTDEYAEKYANEWEISTPVATRAIAPTGTIGIVAETTTGIEPIFCVAYERRYLKGNVWFSQKVVDPCAKRLIENGVRPDLIEDAYDLASDPERRIAFQAWVQQYVDHAISSTINLPRWGSELNNESTLNNFGTILLKYLSKLRGITVYPDGARGGQPLVPIRYEDAVEEYSMNICSLTKGGSCGD